MLGKALARTENIVVQDSGNELLVYDLKLNKAFCLNETSALVWQLCDGKNAVSEMSDKISTQLSTLVSEDLVWLALDQFNRDSLLEAGIEFDDHSTGLSRREVIRKVGFGSLVALPLITSLIAPTAVEARSCGLLTESCVSANGTQGSCCLATLRCTPGSNICNNCYTTGVNTACLGAGCCTTSPFGMQFQNQCCSSAVTETPRPIAGEFNCTCT